MMHSSSGSFGLPRGNPDPDAPSEWVRRHQDPKDDEVPLPVVRLVRVQDNPNRRMTTSRQAPPVKVTPAEYAPKKSSTYRLTCTLLLPSKLGPSTLRPHS